jgi:hypothetical protein
MIGYVGIRIRQRIACSVTARSNGTGETLCDAHHPNVRFWHKADIRIALGDVRVWGPL